MAAKFSALCWMVCTLAAFPVASLGQCPGPINQCADNWICGDVADGCYQIGGFSVKITRHFAKQVFTVASPPFEFQTRAGVTEELPEQDCYTQETFLGANCFEEHLIGTTVHKVKAICPDSAECGYWA